MTTISNDKAGQNDRQLLELAAKAAGIDVCDWRSKYAILPDATYWNPLTDDGDALRLVVKLGLNILFDVWTDGTEVITVDNETVEYVEDDSYTATRRAIVRAAASIASAAEIGNIL